MHRVLGLHILVRVPIFQIEMHEPLTLPIELHVMAQHAVVGLQSAGRVVQLFP